MAARASSGSCGRGAVAAVPADGGRLIGLVVMVVGIGFGSILIGAVAERFVQRDVRETAAEVEREVDAGGDELLRELREVSARRARIEASIAARR